MYSYAFLKSRDIENDIYFSLDPFKSIIVKKSANLKAIKSVINSQSGLHFSFDIVSSLFTYKYLKNGC